jgi:DNA-binding XRE family transcriptional regulator
MQITRYKPDEMIPVVIDLMKEGASKIEVAAELGVSRQTLYDWCDPAKTNYHADFKSAIELGETFSQAWWEKQSRLNLHNKDFNSGMYNFMMKCRFGYTDTQQSQAGFVINWPLGKSKLDR